MPLARVQVRNEFGLGQPELYTEVDREDPKAVLDGLAVAGLVGILRQLGDLAEFASDVFHGLQEEVMNACSRSRKLKVRVQRIEAAFPPLEKAILAQKSHLHLAYTAGSNWHARLRNERNHFISGDLPHFIMDCYEECHDPPRFHLLDKFDTGGPGSCLKRYSDPTFFRRASTGSGEANLDKLSKERKSSRSKKKRTRKRKEICRGGSISNLSGRTQFASFEANSHLSPSQTPSSFDGTFIPDRRGQSNSLDSTAGSGYTYKESPIFSSRMQYEDTLDSASLREHSTILDQSPPSSSCVTWDEKMEILEAESYKYDHEESTEKLSTHSREESPEKTGATDCRNGEIPEKTVDDLTSESQEMEGGDFRNKDRPFIPPRENQEKESDDFGTIGQMGHHRFDDQDKATSVSVQNQVDDVESEPETFEDALNSIESESETDVECQTKREVEHSNSIDNRRLDETHVVDRWKTKPSNTESQVATSNTSNEMTSANEPNVILPRFSVAEKSLHVESESLITIHERNGEVTGSNIESSSTSAESSPLVRRTNEKVTNSCDSQKSSNVSSGIQPVKFWTNGGLLGLEPSKPPDFSAAKQDAVTSNGGGPSNTDQDVRKSNTLFACIASEISSRNNDQDAISTENSSQRFSPAEMVAKREKYGETFEETPDAKSISNGITRQKSDENASLLFGIGNRLTLNGSQRDEKSGPPSSRDTDAFEKRSKNQSVAYKPYSGKGYFGNGSLFNSPSSSPPLQHMKISVQPVNGCDTSKLKLKFPDGSYCHDGSEDMLLSFQLVPESATHHQHENYSDSDDDDTFCRSSPYMSDDCLSHHSESNSDQWESDYTPSNENNTMVYDSFRKPSSTDSVLRSSDFEGEGCESIHFGYIENGGSQQSVEIPSLSTVNPLFEQEMARGFDARDVQSSHFSEELAPLPPPLPPAQWCVAKTPSDVNVSKKETVSEAISYISDAKIVGSTIPPAQWCVEKTPSDVNVSKKETVSEAISYVSDAKIVGSTIPPPPRPKPSLYEKPTETDKDPALKPENKQQVEWQKSNGGREASKAVNGRGTNEKDDFLHQIRTKAFSLRRTTTDKPVAAAVSPGPTAHGGQVTAILEKANAIRQAVGSDNGDDDDDDNWSE